MKVNDDINNVERKIIENIVKGKTNREISANIGKAEATVRNYIYVLFQRFGCKNRTEYVRMLGIKRGTGYGYSLWEFEVYAPPATTPVPTPTQIEAENYSSMLGLSTEMCSDTGGGQDIGSLQPGDWAAYSNINLTGINNIDFRVASTRSGTLHVRLGSPTGTIIGTLNIASTGGWQTWTNTNIPITSSVGTQNIYLTFERADSQAVANINYFEIKP